MITIRSENEKLYSCLVFETAKLSVSNNEIQVSDAIADLLNKITFEQEMDFYAFLPHFKNIPNIIKIFLGKINDKILDLPRLGIFFEDCVKRRQHEMVSILLNWISNYGTIGHPTCFHTECHSSFVRHETFINSYYPFNCNDRKSEILNIAIRNDDIPMFNILIDYKYLTKYFKTESRSNPLIAYLIEYNQYPSLLSGWLLRACKNHTERVILEMYHLRPEPFTSDPFLIGLIKQGSYNIFVKVYHGDVNCEKYLLLALEQGNPNTKTLINHLMKLVAARGGLVYEEQQSTSSNQSVPEVQHEIANNDICSICLSSLHLMYPPCNHGFHIECLDAWTSECIQNGRDTTCPVCRSKFK